MFEYDGKKEWYPSVTYTIMIRRRTLYYWSNLILPCVIIGTFVNLIVIFYSSHNPGFKFFYFIAETLMRYHYPISASLTVLGFCYPPEGGEKVSLEITILMALTFFMQVVSSMQPPSSQIPIISKYFTSILVMVACSVVSLITFRCCNINSQKYMKNNRSLK